MSGAVPPRPARPLGRPAGVPRPVCPGCGRCGRGDQAQAPQHAPLRAGVARSGGGGRASPGGGAFHRCEGRLRSGAAPPPNARLLGRLLGSATHVLWARVCGCGGPTLSPWPACPAGAACRGGGGGPSPGGWPATVVRDVWCQALSLPWPPALWGGQPEFRDPCVPGAVGAGVGPSTGPIACALAGRRCSLWGRQKGIPGGGAFHHGEGRLRSGAPPPPTARPLGGLLGPATHVLWARVCGCGGPTLSPWPASPVGAACRGASGGPSLGGVACHRCEGRLVSGAVPPPATPPLGRAAGIPRPVCPGCRQCGRGTEHWPHSVRPCGPALLAVGMAEGRSRGGAFHSCDGRLWSGAPPP